MLVRNRRSSPHGSVVQRARGLATFGVLSVGLVSFGLAACGGVMTDSGSDDGSSSDLRDSDDSGDGVGTGGSSGVGGTGVCTPLQDGPVGAIEVIIENHSQQTLYLGQEDETCTTLPRFSILGPNGAVDLGDGDLCPITCDDQLNQRDFACPGLCMQASAERLQPGQSYRTSWDARSFEVVDVGECRLPDGTSTCMAYHSVVAGKYEFTARAADDDQCLLLSIDECDAAISCPSDPSAACNLQGRLVYDAFYTATAYVELDALQQVVGSSEGNVVRIVFE